MRQTICVCALFMVVAGSVRAQSPNATVNGEVVDPSGAAIADATVEVVNEATNLRYTTKTSREGIYVIPELPPATYRIEVSHVGFKTVLKPDVIFNVRDAVAINFKLPIGAISETVTVEAGASMINTTDASVSTVVDQTYVKNMPLNGRSFQDLILLTPGAVTQTPQLPQTTTGLGRTGEFSINGQRPEANYYTVDGVSANVGTITGTHAVVGAGPSGSLPAATASGTTQALVSVDDLQEFRVHSSTYSAEYGRNPGGQFAFDTKSGTNQWHGTAYDYLRNGVFDAQDWFNNYFGLSGLVVRQNDFGGTVGGPVRIPGRYNGRDKTFFFVSYEGLRLIQPQPASVNFVPDLCMRGMTACPSGRNPAPSALRQALNAFPMPSPNGIDDVTNGIAQFIGTWSNPSQVDSTSIRLDHIVNDKLKLFFRFSDTTSSSSTRSTSAAVSGTPTSNHTLAYALRTYTAGASSVLSSRLTNDLRLNYSSNEATERNVIDALGGSTPVDLARLSGLSAESVAAVFLRYNGYSIQLLQDHQDSGAQKQWNLVDTVSLYLGRHQLKLGVDYRRLAPTAALGTPFVQHQYTSETSVENNSAFLSVVNNAPVYPLYTNFSAFVQDDWRMSKRLSLSLGLRWEVNPAPGVTQGIKPYTFQGSDPNTLTLAPQGTPLWRTTWYNLAPRLGVAYILNNGPGRETVARGGVGVFFDTGQQLGSLGFNDGLGFRAEMDVPSAAFPVVVAGLVPPILNPPAAPYGLVYSFAPHLQLPYTLQWNASVEQALGKTQALTLSYVGSHAAKLLEQNLLRLNNNPNINLLFNIANMLTSDYDALQIQFRRRLSQGLTALASYTWSHCIDYGSQNYVFGYQRGDCDFDIRHNASVAFSYDLPNVGHSGLARTLLHHWGLDDRLTARSAFPVTLNGRTLQLPNLQLYHAGLNRVQGKPIYLYGANCATVLQGLGDLKPGQGCPGGRAINPQAFTNVSSGLGNAPRNFARGFGALQMDLAVRRDFPIHESLKLQFRAEAFNIFNHPNFGSINGAFGQQTFGQATATLASSLGVLSPLYQMGGGRSMQFALKLVF